MISAPPQQSLFERPDTVKDVKAAIVGILRSQQQPSADELVTLIEKSLGLESRWQIESVVIALADDRELTQSDRGYLGSLIHTGDLAEALRGAQAPNKEFTSTIDSLLQQSRRYHGSTAFQDMINFMGQFRDYSPYNNMLVSVQNPCCGFYATAKDWRERFERTLIEDARPMLILAPMHPLMLVYDLDQTEGKDPPEELLNFAHFDGEWDDRWMSQLIKNAAGHRIRVQFKPQSSTRGGFATLDRESGDWKMRIVVHDGLDEPSRFGVLCHEIAHVLLGHLGSDYDHWWPARTNLSHHALEVEAEATAWIVTRHLGLQGASVAYVSRHLKDRQTPVGVSPDMIAKTSSFIKRMATESMSPRKPRAPRKTRKPK